MSVRIQSYFIILLASCFLSGVANATVYNWNEYIAYKSWSGGDLTIDSGDEVYYVNFTSPSTYVDPDAEVGTLTVEGKFYCNKPARYTESGDTRQLSVESIMVMGSGALFECGTSAQAFTGKFEVTFNESSDCQLSYAALKTTDDQTIPYDFSSANASFDLKLTSDPAGDEPDVIDTITVTLDQNITSINDLAEAINDSIDERIAVTAYVVGSKIEFRASATASNPSQIKISNFTGAASTGSPLFLPASGTKADPASKSSACQGFEVMDAAKLHLFGNKGHNTWTQMATTANAEATSIEVLDASGWAINDAITIAASEVDGIDDLRSADLVQERIITGISGNVLTLNEGLTRKAAGDEPYDYTGNPITYQYGDRLEEGTLANKMELKLVDSTVNEESTRDENDYLVNALKDQEGNFLIDRITDKEDVKLKLDERTEVANKTRNIVFAGTEIGDNQLGMHMMFMDSPGEIHIDGIEIVHGGRIGQLARYPVHWHWANDSEGDFIKNSSIHDSFNRCITVHRTQNVLLEKNVCVNSLGHSYFLEDGNETGNRFIDNISILTRAVPDDKGLLKSDVGTDSDRFSAAAAFWISNPDNILMGNAASSAGTGFWFAFKDEDHNIIVDTPSPNTTPFSVFSGNRVHTATDGMSLDGGPSGLCLYNPRNPCITDSDPSGNRTGDHDFGQWPYGDRVNGVWPETGIVEQIIIDDLTSYKINAFGAWIQADGAATANHMILGDNGTSVAVVFTQDLTNSLIVGASDGLSQNEHDVLSGGSEWYIHGSPLYDGPGKYKHVHYAGFDNEKLAVPFTLFAAASFRPQHQNMEITFEEEDANRIDFAHFTSFFPRHRDNWSAGLYDTDGSISGLTTLAASAGGVSIRPDEEATDSDDISSFFSTDEGDEDCRTPEELLGETEVKIKNATVCPGHFGIITLGGRFHMTLNRLTYNAHYPEVDYIPANSPLSDGDIRQFSFPNALIKMNQLANTKEPDETDDLTYKMNFYADSFSMSNPPETHRVVVSGTATSGVYSLAFTGLPLGTTNTAINFTATSESIAEIGEGLVSAIQANTTLNNLFVVSSSVELDNENHPQSIIKVIAKWRATIFNSYTSTPHFNILPSAPAPAKLKESVILSGGTMREVPFHLNLKLTYQDEWTPWFVLHNPGPYIACNLDPYATHVDVISSVDDLDVKDVPHDLHVRMQANTQDPIAFGSDRDWYTNDATVVCGADTDADGNIDAYESDVDDDGIPNGAPGHTCDGVSYDCDNDNDGTLDDYNDNGIIDGNDDIYPYDPSDSRDVDNDGIGDNLDDDDDNDGLLDVVETDTGIFVDKTDTGTDPLVSNIGLNTDGDFAVISLDPNCAVDIPDTYDTRILDDILEINFSDISAYYNPFISDLDSDGVPDFDEVRAHIANYGSYTVYSCGANTNPASKNKLLQGGNPGCQNVKVQQDTDKEFRTSNVKTLFNGSNTTECGNTATWSSARPPANADRVVITWDMDELFKKHQVLAGIRFQAGTSAAHYNFPKTVEVKVSPTGYFAGEEVSLGQGAFLPPEAEGEWSNWLPVAAYARHNRFVRIEIISQHELGSDADLDTLPVYISETELLAESDNDEDGYSDAVEQAESTDPNDDGSKPVDTDGDYNPDSTDTDDDNDGLIDSEDSSPGNMLLPGYTASQSLLGAEHDAYGYSVSGVGDVNDDSYDDIVVGSPQGDSVNGSNSGNVFVVSGENGSILYTFSGAAANTYLGYSVKGAGDVNDDGAPDIIAGNWGGSGSPGLAKVYSGVDGTTLYTLNGATNGDFFGFSVSGAGDVNDDGYADVVVGAYGASSETGYAKVYSGEDGSVLYTFNGVAAGDDFGHSVSAAGDVNNDGYDDVVVGAYRADSDTGYVKVYSGEDGSVLYTFTGDRASDFMGEQVAAAGDVNNDGYADIVVAASGDDSGGSIMSTYPGYVRVFSGADGSTLYNINSDDSANLNGRSVGYLGDINHDGYDDILVGDYGLATSGGTGSGIVRVYSGHDGTILYTIAQSDEPEAWFGYSVSGAGDTDNDGYVDIVAGAPWDTNTGEPWTVDPNYGSVHIYSGITNYDSWDNDNDGLTNGYELTHSLEVNDVDSDDDGYCDGNGPACSGLTGNNDAFPLDPAEWIDTDLDGVGNNADTDDDGDCIVDGSDAYPLSPESGALDCTFATNGVSVESAISGVSATVQLPNGQLMVAGYTTDGDDDFAIARYNTDGSLDTSFGTGGVVTIAVSASNDDRATAMIMKDDKLIIAGYAYNGTDDDFVVVRYSLNGTADTSFSTDGIVITDVSDLTGNNGNDRALALVQQSDDKIVVAGYAYDGTASQIAVVRYTPDGELDDDSGGGNAVFNPGGTTPGVELITVGSSSEAHAIIQQSDNQLTLAGWSDNGDDDVTLVRLNVDVYGEDDGSPDDTFDTDGVVVYDHGLGDDQAYALVQQASGKLVIAGHYVNGIYDGSGYGLSCGVSCTDYHVMLMRFSDSDGSLDTGFGSSGIKGVDTASAAWDERLDSLMIDSNDNLIAAGRSCVDWNYMPWTCNDYDFLTMRFDEDGEQDDSFNTSYAYTAGVVLTDVGTTDGARAVLEQTDGKLVTAGVSGATEDATLLRYHP